MPKDLSKNCDECGPTITLLQIENGDCIGGFTNESYESTKDFNGKIDEGATLLNFSSH
jgi:hypothetical protein